MEPPAQAWQTLHICSTTSLSCCGERGISSRADTSPPCASASCLHTITYGVSFKTEMRQESQILPFTISTPVFFSLSLSLRWGHNSQPNKWGQSRYLFPYKSFITSWRLGSGYILKVYEMQQGLQAAVLRKHGPRDILCTYPVWVTSKRLNTESICDVATCVIF